jgi:hypothetical protein
MDIKGLSRIQKCRLEIYQIESRATSDPALHTSISSASE